MKRFTDTTIWEKAWYMELTPTEKCAWSYLTDACDNVGVWKPNFRLANFVIGEAVNWDELVANVNGNIKVLEGGKWWLVDFVTFQYGVLKETCKPHLSYIALLKKHSLWKGYRKGINTLQDKEKDKDKDLDKDKEKEREAEITEIIEFFNAKTDSNVRPTTEAIRAKIRSRLRDKYTVPECKGAIAWCFWKWSEDEKMNEFIRIPTIFGAEKFPGYVENYQHEDKE